MRVYLIFDLINFNERNLYACLILLIQLRATKIDIVLFLSSLMLRKRGILTFLVFTKSYIEYLWQGEISVCKVLLPIKVVSVKNDYFLHPKFELHRYQQTNGFLYWRSFY